MESSSGNKHYFGQTAITFKKRWNNHKSDCKLPHKRLATTFSNHMWSLKDMGEESSVSWSKVSVTKPYERGGKTCSLCLTEKVSIARDLSGSMLNKIMGDNEQMSSQGQALPDQCSTSNSKLIPLLLPLNCP